MLALLATSVAFANKFGTKTYKYKYWDSQYRGVGQGWAAG